MSILEDKAAAVASHGSTEVVVDPATILAIINILIQIVKLYQSCQKTPAEAKAHMSRPGWLSRLRVRRMVRDLKDPERVAEGLLHQGKILTVEEIEQLFQASLVR